MKVQQITIGSDPELFLVNTLTGEIESAIDKVGGTKESKLRLRYGHIHEDNIFLEINPRPAITKQQFIQNHLDLLNETSSYLTNLDLSFDLSLGAMEVEAHVLADPKAMQGGCDPDFNVWENADQNPEVYLSDTSLRTPGGHISLGFMGVASKEELRDVQHGFVKAMDLELGLPFLFLDPDRLRRKLYGRAGAFRRRNFETNGYIGVEYRVLSNFWVSQRSYMEFIYDKIHYINNNFEECVSLAEENKKEIIQAVNEYDLELATEVINRTGVQCM